MKTNNRTVIGVDLGGTKVHAARIKNGKIEASFRMEISAQAAKEVVLNELMHAINQVLNSRVQAIGIGVPGLVDVETGVVYDMVNIPSWKEVALQKALYDRFQIPVAINNDANCFALGETYFGTARGFRHVVGLTVGTGLGAGIVLDGKLYCGVNCGAGEFGMLPYKEHNFEYYCSGQFFKNKYGISGYEAYQNALQGDDQALIMFKNFGTHLGQALLAIFYALDPQIIVLGGAVSKAFPFFAEEMRHVLTQTPFRNAVGKLKIKVSEEPNIAVLGAAALALSLDGNSKEVNTSKENLLEHVTNEFHEQEN